MMKWRIPITALLTAAVLLYLPLSVSAECDHVFTDWEKRGENLYRECIICGDSEVTDIPDHVCAGGDWQTNAIQH